jgi:hypothetical protein
MDHDGCGICDECLCPVFIVEEFKVRDEANRDEGNSSQGALTPAWTIAALGSDRLVHVHSLLKQLVDEVIAIKN